ncbi:MAG: hypothetical protein Q9225_006838, partial [Loekoesia sp. 1 TL-2023]
MPLNNLFKKPSESKQPVSAALNSDIFPSPQTTYTLVLSLLLTQHYHTLLYHIQAADVQQFLTELYGYEPFLHWTWIGCTFPPAEIKRQMSYLPTSSPFPSFPSSSSHSSPKGKDNKENDKISISRSQRSALYDFVKKTHAEETQRKE